MADVKAALGTAEAAQRALDGFKGNSDAGGQGDGRQGVGDVVLARDAEDDVAKTEAVGEHLKLGPGGTRVDDAGAEVMLGTVPAVAHGMLIVRAQLGGDGIFGAVDPQALGL